MIYHVVRYGYHPSVPAEERAEVVNLLRRLGSLPCVEAVAVGQDLGPAEDGFDEAVLVSLRDIEAYEQYQRDPTHADIIGYVVPRWAKMAGIDFTDDPAAGLRERMAAAISKGAVGG